MIDRNLVRNYATAVFTSALESGVADLVYDQLRAVNDAFHSDTEIKNMMNYPITTIKDKMGIIEDMAKTFSIENIVKNFLLILVANSRVYILEEVVLLYNKFLYDSKSVKLVDVISATILDKKQQEWIFNHLENSLKQKISISFKQDSSLLAGLVVQYDSMSIDYSVGGVVKKLQDAFF